MVGIQGQSITEGGTTDLKKKKKKGVVYIYKMEYHSATKKNGIMPSAATWMDLEIIILSEVNQTKKDKCCMISLICGI